MFFKKLDKEDQLIRAAECERLLNNPLYSAAKLAVRANIYRAFEGLKHDDDAGRKHCQLQINALDAVFAVFEKEVKNGDFARAQLEKESKGK